MRAWFLVLMVMGSACAKQDTSPATAAEAAALEIDDLAQLAFLNTYAHDERRLLEAATLDPRPEIAAMAVAALYPGDPARWGDALYEHFGIHDHVSRAAGTSEMVTPKETRGALLTIRTSRPATEHHMIAVLFAFRQWRDRDAWVVNMDETVSVSRAFRAAFLDAMWAHEIDRGDLVASVVLDALDARARAEDLPQG